MSDAIEDSANPARTLTRTQEFAIISIGIIAGVIPALQPILLGGLNEAGLLTSAQIGRAGMVEGMGMLLGSFLATLLLPPRALRTFSVIALFLMFVANVFSTMSTGNVILILRAVNGFASGIILWVLVGMLTRATEGARLFAIYVTAQAILATALSWGLSLFVLPTFGIAGGYWLIASLSLILVLPAALLIPGNFAPLASGRIMVPTLAGLAGLFAILCFLAGILALWVYFVPLAAELGHDSKTAGMIVSGAIAVQILGGLCAIWVAGRWSGTRITIASGIGAALAITILIFWGSHFAMLVLAMCLISFFWMFAPPSHLPFLLRLDPGGQSAAFISVAQLGGLSIGPLIASVAVASGNVSGAAWAALSLLFGGAVLGFAVARVSRA